MSIVQSYQVICLSEAVSPITHMAGVAGNEALIARGAVPTETGMSYVPFLSGNALRHRCVRAPGMEWLVAEYGLRGQLTLTQLNFLFHGGSLTEGGGTENTARIAEFHRLWPLGRLLGGSLPSQILGGSLLTWRGMLLCRENASRAEKILGAGMLPGRMRPAESYVSNYQYTRGDAAKRGDAIDGPETKSNLMIFGGQAVMEGAFFLHGFNLRGTEVDLGALLWSLQLWQKEGGSIGGQSARGHGRLALSLVTPDFDPTAAVSAYLKHAREVTSEASAWLVDAFSKSTVKPEAKSKKGSRKQAEEAKAEPETEFLLGADS